MAGKIDLTAVEYLTSEEVRDQWEVIVSAEKDDDQTHCTHHIQFCNPDSPYRERYLQVDAQGKVNMKGSQQMESTSFQLIQWTTHDLRTQLICEGGPQGYSIISMDGRGQLNARPWNKRGDKDDMHTMFKLVNNNTGSLKAIQSMYTQEFLHFDRKGCYLPNGLTRTDGEQPQIQYFKTEAFRKRAS